MDKAYELRALRQTLANLDSVNGIGQHDLVSLGADPVDATLGGGLARGAVHEIFALRTADFAAAASFAAGLALRIENGGPLLWIRPRKAEREAGFLYWHGLHEMGSAAGDVILVVVEDVIAGLRAGLEALRCGGLRGVIFEFWGHSRHLDPTASRRLALAAQQSGALGLMVRVGSEPVPSSALTRWSVTSAPSADPLGLPGLPAMTVELLRQRGAGAMGRWHLEWNHAERCFGLSALSGAVAASFIDRSDRAARDQGWAHAG